MGGWIICLGCKEKLHSMYRHDFKECKCSNHSFVDGGFDYIRYGGKDMSKIKFLSHKHTENGEII